MTCYCRRTNGISLCFLFLKFLQCWSLVLQLPYVCFLCQCFPSLAHFVELNVIAFIQPLTKRVEHYCFHTAAYKNNLLSLECRNLDRSKCSLFIWRVGEPCWRSSYRRNIISDCGFSSFLRGCRLNYYPSFTGMWLE